MGYYHFTYGRSEKENLKNAVSSELVDVLLNPSSSIEASKKGNKITVFSVLASPPAPPNRAEEDKNYPLRLSGTARERMTKIVAEDMPFKKQKDDPRTN